MTHELKCDPEPFQAVFEGTKRCEVRKFERDYMVGNQLELREYDRETGKYSGRSAMVIVTYIVWPGTYGLPDDIGVLSIARLGELAR